MSARPPTSKSPTLKTYESLPSALLTDERAREGGRKHREEGWTYGDVRKMRDDSKEHNASLADRIG